jgi:hypothetical protein
MSLKQDRQGARTPADLERRYNFGKSFAELRGIATDARTHATKAEELALKVQQQILDIDVVKELNVSAGTIILKSQGLSIESNGFSLSADKGIKTIRGNIGLWDISQNGISKFTDNFYVKIDAPLSSSDDVITIAEIEEGVVKATPFLLKANGEISITSEGAEGSTTISAGRLVTNAGQIGGWQISGNDLYSVVSDNNERKMTWVAPNNIQTRCVVGNQTRTVTLADGVLDITRENDSSTVFATFTSGNKSYSLYVDVADNNRLKAYEL